RGSAGSLARRLLPWGLAGPPVSGWVVQQGQALGWYGTRFSMSLLVLACVVSTVLVAFVGARSAARIDRARERAVDELESLNAVLSERVAVAVAESEESRDRMRFLLDSTPVGIFETGPDGVVRYVNQRWMELASVDGAKDHDWQSVLHPADRERVVRDWQAAIAAAREYSTRYRYLRPDGGVTWVEVTARAVTAADGSVTRWLGSVTDVTGQVQAQELLAESERRYRSVVTTMAEGVVLQDGTGRVVTANDAAARLLGVPMDDLVGGSSADPRWQAVREDGTTLPVEDRPALLALRTGRSVRDATIGVHRGDGSLVWLRVNSEPVLDAAGDNVVGAVTTFADVTSIRAAAAALRRSEEQFRQAMAHAPIGMALVELDGRFREVNRALCNLVGYDEDELVGRTFQQITHPDDLEADLDNVGRLLEGSLDHYTMEKRYITRGGDLVWVLLAVSVAREEGDRPAYFVAQIQDITDARAEQQELQRKALHDPLTGLPNRDLLMDHLSHALLRSARSGTSIAVMFCDLDHFKTVNDTYGHEAGDLLLVAVADRLRGVMRPGDTVARLGGDEFVVVAEGLPDAGAVRALGERVLRGLGEPVPVGAHTLHVGVSVGVAVATSEDDARSVLREADAAMYRAKTLGRGRLEVGTPAA
ncbi:MAG: PAS domain S-box protein, partial [Actinomycetes bacterium]